MVDKQSWLRTKLAQPASTGTRHTDPGKVPQAESGASNKRAISLRDYETAALLLQGGGALGAYQAWVFEGLQEAGIEPNWLVGISIGALNTAIIAGNAPEDRVQRLKEFCETICRPAFGMPIPASFENALFNWHEIARNNLTAFQAGSAVVYGQSGFFLPRIPPTPADIAGDPQTASYYDTRPLKATLERLCDFERINTGKIRVSVGAVNARTGNFRYFDNTRAALRLEHFMASGALPPGFAAVEIDGEYYWDGELVSNTPLYEVVRDTQRRDSLIFQVDLWSAQGQVPGSINEVMGRVKDIQYSSRTRLVTDLLQHNQRFHHLVRELLETLPADSGQSHVYELAREMSCDKRYNVIHLIYRDKEYDSHYKDYQFGPTTMRAHWSTGLSDIRQALQNRNWVDMPSNDLGFVTHDVHRDVR
jgi:NTE family protein